MALNLFVGRKRELQRFQEFLTRETPWVMIIGGLGGSGKTTVLDEFARQAPQDTCVVRLDFAQESFREDYLTFLENFSEQVASFCDSDRNYELKKSIATGRYEIGKRIAGGNTNIGKIEQGVSAGTNAEVSKASQNVDVSEVTRQETKRQMREMAREKFYAQMRTFGKQRLVVMLDTCEWLNEETSEAEAARWAGTELIKGLNSRMRNQGKACYVVMASRVPLQLEGINDSEKEQLILKMLDKEEVNQYLENMEIREPAIQDFIFNLTYGHPHSIAIIHNICENFCYDQDRSLCNADIPVIEDKFYEVAYKDIVDQDVLNRLLKSPLDKLTRYGILLRSFNLPLLRAVFQEWLPEPEASNRFNQLVRYPHVERLRGFNYAFNKLLRQILSGYIQALEPDKWKLYHQLALEFLAQTSSRSPDWYYHLLAYDLEKAISYWNDAKTRESTEYIDSLWEVACDRTLLLDKETLQRMNIQRNVAENIA